MIRSRFNYFLAMAVLLAVATPGFAQSRHSNRGNEIEGSIISVTAWRTDEAKEPIKLDNLFLYENGSEQRIRNFSYDPSPSRIVLLVDNSQTVNMDVERMKAAAMEFAYEIFEGDQLFVIAYDEKPEIIQEWTDDATKLETSFASFRKKGNPHLFDALNAAAKEVLMPLMPGTRKTAVVVIGDGLDRGSVSKFDATLAMLQDMDVTVYAIQLTDRTGGAYRRDQPKAGAVLTQLTEGTGGKIFPFDEAQTAAKFICDELRKNRYLLSYLPVNTSSFEPRRVFLVADDGIQVRTKTAQPPNIK
ncbi:MAG: VWA domain-containing protein [Blastocatellia bacterium]|nr:VWA domain-containing protein [Blastocatellia bacterium]